MIERGQGVSLAAAKLSDERENRRGVFSLAVQAPKYSPDVFAKRAIGVATAASVPTRADADARYAALPLTLENRTSDPVSPTVGQMWLRTDL